MHRAHETWLEFRDLRLERETDLASDRSVARVLLAYFKGLKREDVADLDVPLGMLYMLEPVRIYL